MAERSYLKKVAVIIPCRDEGRYIVKCLQSLLASDYPEELLEIFVVDGMSNDGTRKIISSLAEKYQQIKLLDNKQKTTPYALNIGLKNAQADVKIILGAHSEVNKGFVLENVVALDTDDEVGCAGGVLENVYENKTAEIIGKAMSSPFGVGNAHFRTGGKSDYVDTVAFGAYKSSVFDKVGYFDEALTRNQDDEFNYRLTKAGYKIWLSEKIKCKYYVRATFGKLFSQYFQYGYWKVFVNKKHKTITTLRQLIPLFFVLFLLFGGVITMLFPILLVGYGAILALYVFIGLVESFRAKAHPFLLIFAFATLHFSYGMGYLIGVWDFLLLGKKTKATNSSK